MKRPITLWLLVGCLLFLAFGGLYGGITMLVDPSGKLLQADSLLPRLPVPNFILPGLFLLILMGLFPLLLAYGLLAHPSWAFFDTASRWSRHYWAWTGVIGLCCILGIWLAVQYLMIGFTAPIQFIITGCGVLILVLALLPGIRKRSR